MLVRIAYAQHRQQREADIPESFVNSLPDLPSKILCMLRPRADAGDTRGKFSRRGNASRGLAGEYMSLRDWNTASDRIFMTKSVVIPSHIGHLQKAVGTAMGALIRSSISKFSSSCSQVFKTLYWPFSGEFCCPLQPCVAAVFSVQPSKSYHGLLVDLEVQPEISL